MRRSSFFALCVLLPGTVAAQSPEGPRTRIRGYVAAEPRLFPQDARFSEQAWFDASLAAEPELRHEWDGRSKSFVVTPFLRLDQNDGERTHFDVREAAFRLVTTDSSCWPASPRSSGASPSRSTSWTSSTRRTSSRTPTARTSSASSCSTLTLARSWGTLNLFVLPGARERTFPGRDGRLGPSVVVDADAAVFEAGRWHVDLAARWSRTIGVVDLGVSHFYGTSREPRLVPEPADTGTNAWCPTTTSSTRRAWMRS